MVSKEHNKELKKFRAKMEKIGKFLPKDWVKKILSKKEGLSIEEYQCLYNTLVNWRQGRSYKSAQENPELINEMIKLSNAYKRIES